MNPGAQLPPKQISVISRSDKSGTTYLFTSYLSQISDEWKKSLGANILISWPIGKGENGNNGVTQALKNTEGGIAYVEYSYAADNKLQVVHLKNRDGVFVAPTSESFVAAAASAPWNRSIDFSLLLVNQPGKDAWPIVGMNYILINLNSI